MINLIERPRYLDILIGFKDKELVKILTGIRRSGKSTIFRLYQNYLKNNGVQDEQIINLNLEDAFYKDLLKWENLHDFIIKKLLPNKQNYIFLDEIQNVSDFESAVNSLRLKENVDIYLTGSNSRLSSGEIGTVLRGRFVEIKIQPLSFKEYSAAYPYERTPEDKFNDYLHNSSFPYALQFSANPMDDFNKEQIRIFLDGLYTSVVNRDVMERFGINDLTKLESVIKFIFDNIGCETSIKNISNMMKNEGRVVQTADIDKYLDALMKSYIVYKAERYDIKGKQLLQTNSKYYVADIGLRYFLLGKEGDEGYILENVVYLELLRRGYKVFVGKVGSAEIDFAAAKNGITQYYQVSQTVLDKNTLERELAPLDSIRDHNQKFLLTMDRKEASYNGIQHINILDWLVGTNNGN
jgi:predicted AAA+ superfamily ATPase